MITFGDLFPETSLRRLNVDDFFMHSPLAFNFQQAFFEVEREVLLELVRHNQALQLLLLMNYAMVKVLEAFGQFEKDGELLLGFGFARNQLLQCSELQIYVVFEFQSGLHVKLGHDRKVQVLEVAVVLRKDYVIVLAHF